MSVSVSYAAKATVTETLNNTPSAAAASKVVTHSEYDESATLTGATTPPVTTVAEFLLALSAGAATIDLRALAGTNGAVIDGNGLKVQIFRVKNLGANVMTFTEGASNGYALFGSGNSVTVPPGGCVMVNFNDGSPDVSGTDKAIDVAGTAAQTAEVTVILG